MTRLRAGKVQAPKPDKYLYSNLFKRNVQKEFVGSEGTMKELKSEDGQAKIASAHTATEASLGYSRNEAEKQDALEDAFSELQWAKPEKSGEDELACTSCEEIM